MLEVVQRHVYIVFCGLGLSRSIRWQIGTVGIRLLNPLSENFRRDEHHGSNTALAIRMHGHHGW